MGVLALALLAVAFDLGTWGDYLIGPSLQEDHVSLFADARLEIVPNAGHGVVDDKPGATPGLTREFLAQ